MKVLWMLIFLCSVSHQTLAEGTHDDVKNKNKNKKWHCEKTVNGKTTEMKKIKDRRECKKSGGKWKKGYQHDKKNDDGHKNHDGHDHN